jgi:LPS-assembly lipoprotein
MSLSDRVSRLLRPSLVVVAALSLGGCLQPLHGGTGTAGLSAPGAAGATARGMAAIDILPIDGRVGQQIRNNLIFAFTGGSAAPAPLYRLDVSVQVIGTQTAVVDPYTDRPEVETAGVDAAFTLTQIGTGTPAFNGKAFGRATYTRTRQRYASVRAQRDAEDRAATMVVEQIRAQLQGHFSKGS